MERIKQIFIRIFYITFLIFPVWTVILTAGMMWSFDKTKYSLASWICFAALAEIFFLGVWRGGFSRFRWFRRLISPGPDVETDWKQKRYMWIAPLLLFCTALCVRVLSVCLIGRNCTQVSDFAFADTYAKNPQGGNGTYAVFPYWGMFAQVLRLAYSVFGANVLSGQMLNAFMGAFVTVILYFTVLVGFRNGRMAVIASVLFCFWPSNVLYVNLLSNEFLVMFFLSLSVLLYVCVKRAEIVEETGTGKSRKFYIKILLYCILGVSFAVTNAFKPYGALLILAVIMVEILLYIRWERINFRKSVIGKGICFGVMFVVYLIGGKAGTIFLEKMLAEKVNTHMTAYTLYIGLNSSGRGIWEAETAGAYFEILRETNMDYEEASQRVTALLKEDMKEHYGLLPGTFVRKTALNWAGDTSVLGWVQASMEENGDRSVAGSSFSMYMKELSNFYYLIVMIFIAIGVIIARKRKNNGTYLFCALFLFGVWLIFFVVEAQGRYKSVLVPALCVLGAFGIVQSLARGVKDREI